MYRAKDLIRYPEKMSQATLIGLCSDNVVTILQPSSTIECPCTSGIYTGVSDASGTYTVPVQIPVVGSIYIEGTVSGPGPTTVTIGDFAVTSTAVTIPFQTFAQAYGTLFLTVSGPGPITYTYRILTKH